MCGRKAAREIGVCPCFSGSPTGRAIWPRAQARGRNRGHVPVFDPVYNLRLHFSLAELASLYGSPSPDRSARISASCDAAGQPAPADFLRRRGLCALSGFDGDRLHSTRRGMLGLVPHAQPCPPHPGTRPPGKPRERGRRSPSPLYAPYQYPRGLDGVSLAGALQLARHGRRPRTGCGSLCGKKQGHTPFIPFPTSVARLVWGAIVGRIWFPVQRAMRPRPWGSRSP